MAERGIAGLIEAAALTTFDVTPDGKRVRLHVRDLAGRPGTLSLPLDSLNQLMMTMPEMARQAFRARYRDDTLRIVYPLGDWKIEQGAERGCLILTLKTRDGFEIAFSLAAADCTALGDDLAEAPAAPLPHAAVN